MAGKTSTRSIIILLCVAFIAKVESQTKSQESESSGTGSPQCMEDCSNAPKINLCASDVNSYSSLCEYDVAQCLRELEGKSPLTIIHYDHACELVVDTPVNLCQQHQKEFDELPADEYDELCPHDILKEKKRNGSLTVEDLLPCYKPSCDQRQYKQHQCSYNFNSICWCADSEGNPTDGLFEKGQKVCPKPAMDCEYKGKTHLHGSEFIDGCGYCDCFDGRVECYKDYDNNSTDSETLQLQSEEIEMLKRDLLQYFNFQYLHGNNHTVQTDIKHIRNNTVIVLESAKMEILQWKFHYYDVNNNDILSSQELYHFRTDLVKLIRCESFFDSLIEEIMDDDEELNIQTWGNFFDVELQPETSGHSASVLPVKRSAPSPSSLLRLQKRKKFYYTLQ